MSNSSPASKVNRWKKQRTLREVFVNENGAIDLASIMVGIIVIGIIGGVIAATVFAVIPWAQDNSAKDALSSVTTAESAYSGFSSDQGKVYFGNLSELEGVTPSHGVTQTVLPAASVKGKLNVAATGEGSSAGYAAISRSDTGRYFYLTFPGDGKPKDGGMTLAAAQAAAASDAGETFAWTNTDGDATHAGTGVNLVDSTTTASGSGSTSGGSGSGSTDTTPGMVLKINPANDPGCATYQLPIGDNTNSTSGGSVNATINWGDGTTTSTTTNGPSHTYTDLSPKTITVTGNFTAFDQNYFGDSSDLPCLTAVTKWQGTGTTNLEAAFAGDTNLTTVAQIPSGVTIMDYAFNNDTNFNDASLKNWDVSQVTWFFGMFAGATNFNQDLSGWKTSNAVYMSAMFNNDSAFNQDLSGWDVHNVTWSSAFGAGSGMTAAQMPHFTS